MDRIEDMYAHRNEPEALHLLATIYWRVLLTLSFAALVGIFLYGTWMLEKVLSDLGTTSEKFSAPTPVLNRAMLTATLGALENRRATFEDLKTHAKTFPDPSR